MEVRMEETFFQQDGARTHSVNAVLHLQSEIFRDGSSLIDIPDDLELDYLGHHTHRI
jgi:hypothetical protein